MNNPTEGQSQDLENLRSEQSAHSSPKTVSNLKRNTVDSSDLPDADLSSDDNTNHATQKTIISNDSHVLDTVIESQSQINVAKKRPEDHYDTLTNDSDHSPFSSSDPEGTVIGDYQILSELGRGGMGVVYKAIHRKLNRVVALKMILGGTHASNESLERFITEAQSVARLQHSGIVQIFSIGEHDGLPYFSLEYVEGSDLQKTLDRKPQDPFKAALLVEKLAMAMQYAHENSILHRDLKPSNILIGEDGEPKITDFGLAKQVQEESGTETTTGTIMGSPSYMPPEQARGELSSVNPRSDLYSLGAVLYEMLTGRPPFLAKKPLETVMQVVNKDPVAPCELQPDIPKDIETICLKALQKEQASRYANCQALAEDLRRFLDNKPIQARPISAWERLTKWCRRNPKIAIPSGLAVSAIALTAVIALWAWQTTSAQAAIISVQRDNAQEQRDEAQNQRDIARQQRQAAEAAKQEAEEQRLIAVKAQEQAEKNEEIARKQTLIALKNIQFVLTNVDAKLRGKPQMSDIRLGLLESISKKWDEIDIDLAGGEQGEAAATRLAIRKKIAEIYTDLDKLDIADAEYAKLFEAGQQRVKIKNRSDATRYNLAQIAVDWAPLKKRATNDPRTAVEMLNTAAQLMDEIFNDPRPEDGSPPRLQLLKVRGQILQNTGREYLYSGQLNQAIEKFQAALRDNQAIIDAIPTDPQFKDNTALRDVFLAAFRRNADQSRLSIGYAELRRGQTELALNLYQQVIDNRRAERKKTPEDMITIATLGGFLNIYGKSLLWLGQLDQAEQMLTEALAFNQQVYEMDTKLAANSRTLALNHYRIASLKTLQGKTEEAATFAQTARDLYATLFEQSNDRKNKINMMLAEAKCGNRQPAVKLAQELSQTEIQDTEVHFDRSRALALLSVAAQTDEDRTNDVNAALAAIEQCVADGYTDAFRISREPDLHALHNETRFQAIVYQLSKQNQRPTESPE